MQQGRDLSQDCLDQNRVTGVEGMGIAGVGSINLVVVGSLGEGWYGQGGKEEDEGYGAGWHESYIVEL